MKNIVIYSMSVFVLSIIFLGAAPNYKKADNSVKLIKIFFDKSGEWVAVPSGTPIKFKMIVNADYKHTVEIKYGETRITGSGRGEGNVIKEGSFTCNGTVEVSIVHIEPNGTTQINKTRVEDIDVYTTGQGYSTIGKRVRSDDGGGVVDEDYNDCEVELKW